MARLTDGIFRRPRRSTELIFAGRTCLCWGSFVLARILAVSPGLGAQLTDGCSSMLRGKAFVEERCTFVSDLCANDNRFWEWEMRRGGGGGGTVEQRTGTVGAAASGLQSQLQTKNFLLHSCSWQIHQWAGSLSLYWSRVLNWLCLSQQHMSGLCLNPLTELTDI